MIRAFFLILFLICGEKAFPQSQAKDILFDLLKHEVGFYYNKLKTDSVPPRIISFSALDEKTVCINSDMGYASLHESSSRKFCPFVSFGESSGGQRLNPFDLSEEDWLDSQPQVVEMPLDNDTVAIKSVIWNALGKTYRGASVVRQRTMQHSKQELIATHEVLPIEMHYEEPRAEVNIDKEKWRGLLNGITLRRTRKMPEISCRASIECQSQRRYIVDSSGGSVVCNRLTYTLNLFVTVEDSIGTKCPLAKTYFEYEESRLPDEATLMSDMEALACRALALSKAPMADAAYSGPVILSGSASAVFFMKF